MIFPDIPENEATRLDSLRGLGILDTAAEAGFDALARAASIVCKTPISLLSLVDADRQWFKANVGLDGTDQTPRAIAFCAHAIHDAAVLEVPDASHDLRFHDNPLVTGAPGVRFYAGAPVVLSDGAAVGTLCVIDHEPRQLSGMQRDVLQQLAVAAAYCLEGRRAGHLLASKEASLRSYRDNIESEAEIARFLLARMSRMDSLDEPGISHLCLAAESFSGDLIAVARSSAGDLYGMLVDSTGHGLSAAIHLVPVTTAFYDMAERGFTLDSMARRMNQAIKDYSPPDRFVAVTLVRSLARELQLEVLNAGNPPAVLVSVDREIRRSFRSGSVPLGILEDAAFRCRVEVCRVAEGELLLLCSDGLIEACNPAGVPFGGDGLAQAIAAIAPDQDPAAAIRAAFERHCSGAPPLDDVTILALQLPARSGAPEALRSSARTRTDPRPIAAGGTTISGQTEDDWEVSLRFSSAQLRRLDIVPAVMELGRTLGLDDATESRLFLVLNELTTNAIDHGLLGLDSSLKTGAEGLARYFALREERLQNLTRASLQIRICRREIPGEPARIALELRDSGSGFDHAAHLALADEALREARGHASAPRGLALVLDLCDCLVYEDAGRTVRVEFPGH